MPPSPRAARSRVSRALVQQRHGARAAGVAAAAAAFLSAWSPVLPASPALVSSPPARRQASVGLAASLSDVAAATAQKRRRRRADTAPLHKGEKVLKRPSRREKILDPLAELKGFKSPEQLQKEKAMKLKQRAKKIAEQPFQTASESLKELRRLDKEAWAAGNFADTIPGRMVAGGTFLCMAFFLVMEVGINSPFFERKMPIWNPFREPAFTPTAGPETPEGEMKKELAKLPKVPGVVDGQFTEEIQDKRTHAWQSFEDRKVVNAVQDKEWARYKAKMAAQPQKSQTK